MFTRGWQWPVARGGWKRRTRRKEMHRGKKGSSSQLCCSLSLYNTRRERASKRVVNPVEVAVALSAAASGRRSQLKNQRRLSSSQSPFNSQSSSMLLCKTRVCSFLQKNCIRQDTIETREFLTIRRDNTSMSVERRVFEFARFRVQI